MSKQRSSGGFTLIELMIIVVIIGILAAIFVPNFVSIQDRAKEAKTKGIAHSTQLAVEDWAVRRNGIYPMVPKNPQYYLQVSETLPFIEYLPGQQFQENAFSGELSEPRLAWSNPPTDPVPGGVYYYKDDRMSGYVIVAYGKYPEQGPIARLSNGD